jgi:hypothetical protein
MRCEGSGWLWEQQPYDSVFITDDWPVGGESRGEGLVTCGNGLREGCLGMTMTPRYVGGWGRGLQWMPADVGASRICFWEVIS